MSIACPHCSVSTDTPESFCAECGKAMPPITPTAPRIVRGTDLAESSAGRALQLEEIEKHASTGFRCMLVLAGLLFVGGGVLFFEASERAPGVDPVPRIAGMSVASIGMAFLGLALWARRSPLAASLTGLVLVISLWTLSAILDPMSIHQYLIVKVAMVFGLLTAIRASIKHRSLTQQMACCSGTAPQPMLKAA